MYCISDQLDDIEDDLALDDIEGDEQSDWLNYTDSNLSCEEIALSKENDTATTEGEIQTLYVLYVHTCVHIQNISHPWSVLYHTKTHLGYFCRQYS